MRTMREILIEADEKESVWELEMLWNEMVANKYKYPLIHLRFAKEHIDWLILKVQLKKKVEIKAEF